MSDRPAVVVFLRAVVGPFIGGLLGAVVALVVGAEVMLAAGHGLGHASEAAVLFLGAWAVAIVIGAALGVCAFLALATLVRLLIFALGRRPWPWSGSVHGGALAAGLLLALSSRGCAGWIGSRGGAGGDTALPRFIVYVAGGVAAVPAMIIGGALAGFLHRQRSKRSRSADS